MDKIEALLKELTDMENHIKSSLEDFDKVLIETKKAVAEFEKTSTKEKRIKELVEKMEALPNRTDIPDKIKCLVYSELEMRFIRELHNYRGITPYEMALQRSVERRIGWQW